MPMKIAVTGATGFIGSRLVKLLQGEGHSVAALTRTAAQARAVFPKGHYSGVEIVQYDPYRLGDWARALEGCDGVVHLAGAPIAGRWTHDFKSQIKMSREIGTRRIVEAISQASQRPSVLVSSSATRYYGSSETATFDETSPAHSGQDYLAGVCRVWEAEAKAAELLGLRTVILRHGVVLDMTPRFRDVIKTFGRFIGGRIGSGRQWLSWIHREDTVRVILKALSEETMHGVYNATGPNPVRMDDFTRELGAAVGGRFHLPAPGFVIQGLLGDGATVILDGQRVIPARLLSEGFTYRLPDLRKAIASSL